MSLFDPVTSLANRDANREAYRGATPLFVTIVTARVMSPLSSHSSRCRSRAGSPGQMAPTGVERSESALRRIAACARLAVALIVSLLSGMVTLSLTLSATVARHRSPPPLRNHRVTRLRQT